MIENAPKYINQRLSSVNKYTWSVFFPGNSLNEHLRKKKTKTERTKELSRLREIINEASYVVFVFLLNKFFIEGTKSAQKAVDTFKELNVNEFFIGSKNFSGRNENVMRGKNLSIKLMEFIKKNHKLYQLVNEANYVSDIISQYREFINEK